MPTKADWGALADEVMALWPVTGVTVVDEVSSYPTRRVLHLRCDQGDVVAKIDLQPCMGAVPEQRLAVLDHLASRSFPHAPALVRTSAGTRTSWTPSRTMVVLEYIASPLVSGRHDGVRGWRDLGSAAARLNGLTDYDVPFAVPVEEALQQLATRAAGTPFEAGLCSLVARIEHLIALDELGLIHGEINQTNAKRRNDEEVVLLDWDHAGIGPRILEYGYPLIVAFVSDDLVVDVQSVRAFYRGYTDAGGNIDHDRLFDAALFHALRYMWFGDVERRWDRIMHALSHEDRLTSLASSHR